jgi:hypothetical protein
MNFYQCTNKVEIILLDNISPFDIIMYVGEPMPANNVKWYIDENGEKVKPCSQCKRVLPYRKPYYSTRGNGKWSAYCTECANKKSKKYNKTSQTRKSYYPFVENGTEYKQCTKCDEIYPHTFEYYDHSSGGKGGFLATCRKCRLNYNHEFAERKWALQLYFNAKRSTQRYGFEPMDIDEEYILDLYSAQKGKCYWLGVDLVPSRLKKYPFQPSLDRLDRHRGYVQDNVVLCCFAANFGRNENTEDSWKEFLLRMMEELNYEQWK